MVGAGGTIVLSQYTTITSPFQTVFNGGWSSMCQYIEKGLMGVINTLIVVVCRAGLGACCYHNHRGTRPTQWVKRCQKSTCAHLIIFFLIILPTFVGHLISTKNVSKVMVQVPKITLNGFFIKITK